VVWGGCDGGGIVVVERFYFGIVCYILSITFLSRTANQRLFSDVLLASNV
jgi:hypothetical protein